MDGDTEKYYWRLTESRSHAFRKTLFLAATETVIKERHPVTLGVCKIRNISEKQQRVEMCNTQSCPKWRRMWANLKFIHFGVTERLNSAIWGQPVWNPIVAKTRKQRENGARETSIFNSPLI